MFGDVVDPSVKVGTKQWYTVPLSIVAHVVVLGSLIVIPLLATDMLPTPQSVMAFVPPPPPPPPAAAPPPEPVQPVSNPSAAPVEAPREIKPEPPPRMTAVVGGIANNFSGATGGVASMAPPPPPPPPPAPIRVGGQVKEPKRVSGPNPIYPKIAQAAKVQGMVILEATITKEGNVRDIKVLRPQPMGMTDAAVEAVKNWKYSPPLLNGVPVDVIMTVTVNFALQ
jgi:protein TonB